MALTLSPGLQGVASRDIKLENTLLDGSPRPLLKICDFGYSKVCALCLLRAALGPSASWDGCLALLSCCLHQAADPC